MRTPTSLADRDRRSTYLQLSRWPLKSSLARLRTASLGSCAGAWWGPGPLGLLLMRPIRGRCAWRGTWRRRLRRAVAKVACGGAVPPQPGAGVRGPGRLTAARSVRSSSATRACSRLSRRRGLESNRRDRTAWVMLGQVSAPRLLCDETRPAPCRLQSTTCRSYSSAEGTSLAMYRLRLWRTARVRLLMGTRLLLTSVPHHPRNTSPHLTSHE